MKNFFLAVLSLGLFIGSVPLTALLPAPKATPKNIIFILSDDHRYDFMGFTGKVAGLQTPNLDRLAREGAHVQNAFVSTALCSPSRASILSGQYAHTHKVVDNFAPMPKGLTFFPQYLKKAGYQTAFLGKWHMGNTGDQPQPGFDYWLSFKGQGVYYNPTFNINGKQVSHTDSSHTTDLLTDYAVKWLNTVDKKKPFMLYLSHKAVHAMFEPTRRHRGQYRNVPINYPRSMYLTATDTSKIWGPKPSVDPETGALKANVADMPNWVKQQRGSWHGVDYMYHGQIGFNDFYRQYAETLLGVDESVGRVLTWLEANGLSENTMVVYMGDNGFSFGERGLIDKRHAYDESMRVPLLVRCPAVVKPGTKLTSVVQNIDIAPMLLNYAGLPKPAQMQGNSFLPLLAGKTIPWRDRAFYEYYWEVDFPQTPTMFAARTDRYKYIFNYGVWDANELYDLQNDPGEVNNLIRSPQHQDIARQLRGELFTWLETTQGMQIPLNKVQQKRFDHRFKGTY
ncbi:sulfatase [Spirosoma montaniterrae]|uniref:Acetylglucosamine-6-sulfatase n=1 Tax=Spirosoma montaniterrae TaxID=1178516 RepID=A0A1P9WZQ9_9BACT|nr:sulfatase [Spirosoma montaniterrae]AQG80871.1 acetylglucosamine-6-sulfatase [Spirosoma montaniterrae]